MTDFEERPQQTTQTADDESNHARKNHDDINTEFDNEPDSDEIVTLSTAAFKYAIIAVTFMTLGIVIGALGFGQNNSQPALTTADVEDVVRRVLDSYDFSAGSEVDRFALVDDDPYLGPEDAPVVIVEFSDFRCPYCGRHYEQTLEPLLENYGDYVRYVYRDLAIISQESLPAAMAAECAHEQGKFWEFHNAFFQNQDRLGRAFYIEQAETFELDVERFTTCYDEAEYLNEVQNDVVDAQIEGVSGTPGFFINGMFLSGARPYETFERLIQRELEDAGIDWRTAES